MQHSREYELKIFSPQRAFRSVMLHPTQVRDCLILLCFFEAIVAVFLPQIQVFWRSAHTFLLSFVTTHVPQPPGEFEKVVGLILTAALILFPRFFSERFTPFKYFLRFLGFVTLMCLIFSQELSLTTDDLLKFQRDSMMYSLFLGPFLLSFSLYLIPVGFRRKFITTLLLLIYLVIFTPFLTSSSYVLLSSLSTLVLPIIFLTTGPLLFFAFFMSFFTWGLSGASR